MLIESTESDFAEIGKILKDTFEKPNVLEMGKAASDTKAQYKRRHIAQYPTAAITIIDRAGLKPGFFACFTVLGATREPAMKELIGPISPQAI